MKQSVRATTAILAIPLTLLLLAACSKKASQQPVDSGPEVSQGIGVTKPSRGGTTGGSLSTPSDQSPQILATRGEDIPIAEAPSLEFRDPTEEEKQILKNIYFDFDRSTIRPEFQPVLEGVAGWLNDRPTK